MIFPSKGRAIVMLWTLCVLSSRFASSEYGYSVTMPLSSMQMYDDRARRSLASICVEIKPNGPLEEPYYMCKGADFPTVPKKLGAGNMAAPNYGSSPSFSGNPVQQSPPNSAPINYNGATYGENFRGYQANNAGQSGHNQLVFSTSNAQSSPKPFQDQTANFYPKSMERNEQHFSSEHQQHFNPPTYHQQQQHHFQQQAQHQQFPQNNQQQYPAIHPATSFQSSFQKTEQFFRPGTKSESKGTNEKINGYDSNYSEIGSNSGSAQQSGSIPSTPYSAQHTRGFGAQSATPAFQNTATTTGISSSTSQNQQRFDSTQFALHGVPDCGENCRTPATQITSSGDATQNGVNQYAAKSTAHNSGYASTSNQFFSDGASQHSFAHSTIPAAIPIGNVQDSPSVPSSNYPPATNAGTSTTSSTRYADSGANTFTAPDGSSVPNLGPNNTPPLGPALLGPARGKAYHNEASSFDGFSGSRRSQTTHSEQTEVEQGNKHPPFHPQDPNVPPKPVPLPQRYRSMIDDDVLQMPNWGFTNDELDLYRSMAGVEENAKPKLTDMPPPVFAPPRVIPIEHLEDPVMRAFYSSLDDVGPLPVVLPPLPLNRAQLPAAYNRPLQRILPYQSPLQSCVQQPAPQYYNYSPCPPQREYSFQPIFIALPCYGQSMYPNLGSPAPTTMTGNSMAASVLSVQTGASRQMLPPTTNTEVRTENAEIDSTKSLSKNGNTESIQSIQKDLNSKVFNSTTVATTTTDYSNESSESVEDLMPTTTKANQTRSKGDVVIGSAELKSTIPERPKVVKFDTKVQVAATTAVPKPLIEVVGKPTTANPVTTADPMNGQMVSEMSTTFKSLIFRARQLAQMVSTSQEDDDMMYKDEVSTPKPAPKKIRQAPLFDKQQYLERQ